MDDSLELFSAFGNLAFAALVALAAALTWAAARRLPRARRVAAVAVVALVLAAGLIASAHLALRDLGAPTFVVERIAGACFVSVRRWSAPQRVLLVRASLSPLHRRAVKALFDAPRLVTEPFPPLDVAGIARLRGWMRGRGDCASEALLDRRLGDFERAASARCDRTGAARESAEAALATGDVARAWTLLAPRRSEVTDGFDGRLLTLHERPDDGALSTLPRVAPHERPLWACVMARVQQRLRGDRDATFWTPMLASPLAACRILAATAPARRDPDALRALTRLPVAALRAWPTTLSAARALLAVSGKLEAVPCPVRRVPALDAAWLARYPSLAATIRHELRREGCAFVMMRVWFPTTQALASFEAGDPEGGAMEAYEDLTVAWQLTEASWDRVRTLLDPRFSRRRRAGLARSFRSGLGPVVSWSVGRLDAAWADGSPWSRGFAWPSALTVLDALPPRDTFAHEPFLHALDIPHYAVRTVKRWDLDVLRVPAHHPVLDAWIDYWRTGEFAPAHDAPVWLRDDSMRAVADAAAEGDVATVLGRLGPPSLHGAEQLAAVAYRLQGDLGAFDPWLRRAWGSLDPGAMPLREWEGGLQTLRTCALRLRLASLRHDVEAALVRVRRMRREGDGFVQAVLDGPRPAPPEPDDDEGE
jgi:hypothetical protein